MPTTNWRPCPFCGELPDLKDELWNECADRVEPVYLAHSCFNGTEVLVSGFDEEEVRQRWNGSGEQ